MIDMRTLFLALAFVLGLLLVVGSSGNFRSYGSVRNVSVMVVPHDQEYVGFRCSDGYAAVVTIGRNSTLDFDALTVMNYLPGDHDISLTLEPDRSSLPAGLGVEVETENGVSAVLSPGEERTLTGRITSRNVAPGVYVIPMALYAEWDGGSASLSPCPLKVVVTGEPTIEKTLVFGNATVGRGARGPWTFRITVTNPTSEPLELTVTDFIPADFRVVPCGIRASSGFYFLTPSGCGCRRGVRLIWYVRVPSGGSEHIDVTVRARHCGLSCGTHTLNSGARIVEYGIESNGLRVRVVCNRSFSEEDDSR